MKLSTSTNICAFNGDGTKNGLDYSIELCARAGYKYLDINFCEAMNPTSRMKDDDWEDYVREIEAMGRRWGITFTQSHLPYYDIFGENDPGKVKLMEELIRRSILASGMLGVRWAVTHPGTVYSAGHNWQESLESNLEYYSRHLKTATAAGVGIALENDFEYQHKQPRQRIFASSVYELCELADRFSSPHIGICYDFGHAILTGGFHRQNLNTIGKRLKAVHVQDNYGAHDAHFLPFFGITDWADAMKGLADIGYQGELTYEVQEFAKYMPKELKYAALDLSIVVGNYLIGLYDQAVADRDRQK